MREILNIFRKDVRHLWPQILVIWTLFVVFDILDILSFPIDVPETHRINRLSGLAMLLLVLGIWYLVALAIYQEPLPGDRQFWLTRPYSRMRLLAEKALFIVVFINLPLFFSDCFILGLQSFPVLNSVRQLLLRQVVASTLFILPSFAIATLTRGVAQFVFAWFLILLGFIAQTMLATASSGGGVAFDSSGGLYAVIAVVALSIIVWQYATRQTIAGRAVLLALAFLGVSAFSVVPLLARHVPGLHPQPQLRSTGPANIHISYESGNARRRSGQPANGWIELSFPIRVEGLPIDTLLEGGGEATIEVDGKAWPKPGWQPVTSIERILGQYWQTMRLETSVVDGLKNREVNVESSFRLALFTDKIQTSIPVAEKSFWVPNLGHCYSGQLLAMTELACRAGPRSIPMTLRIDEGSYERAYTPVFAQPTWQWGLSPTYDLTGGMVGDLRKNATFDFIPRREITTFNRKLRLSDVYLIDYALGH